LPSPICLALDRHAVTAQERVFLADHVHERAVGALVRERERLRLNSMPRMQPRDEITADDHVAVVARPMTSCDGVHHDVLVP